MTMYIVIWGKIKRIAGAHHFARAKSYRAVHAGHVPMGISSVTSVRKTPPPLCVYDSLACAIGTNPRTYTTCMLHSSLWCSNLVEDQPKTAAN
eukprot:675283-Amphidinium_carterae.3